MCARVWNAVRALFVVFILNRQFHFSLSFFGVYGNDRKSERKKTKIKYICDNKQSFLLNCEFMLISRSLCFFVCVYVLIERLHKRTRSRHTFNCSFCSALFGCRWRNCELRSFVIVISPKFKRFYFSLFRFESFRFFIRIAALTIPRLVCAQSVKVIRRPMDV